MRFRKPILSPKRRRLSRALTIYDLRDIAKRRTPKAPFDYTDGGADSESSLTRARRAFEAIEFSPRVLRDVSGADLSVEMLGVTHAMPVGIAPTGFTRMMQTEGEIAGCTAARDAGIPYTLSTMGTRSIEDVERAAPDGRNWFQLYMWKDRERSMGLVDRAAKAGVDTLVLTVDWWMNFLTTDPLKFASLDQWKGTVAELLDSMFDPSVTFDDLKWIRKQWDGNLVVKGIQNVEDAKLAVKAGADAIFLSNHGGRQLDRAPIPFHLIPDVRKALGKNTEIHVDTGIMHGADVIASIALGANFTWIGRAYLYGLMAGGKEGVDRSLEILRTQMVRTMKLLGARSLAELKPEHVHLIQK
ncbi:MAG: hypothetical protein RL129_790 [Actinomycetota bacterium]